MSLYASRRRQEGRSSARTLGSVAVGASVVIAVGLIAQVQGYQSYSTSGGSAGNCASCHGDFRSSPYTSKVDGQSWGDDLHDVHRRTMLNSDCNTCHTGSSRVPTLIGSSNGGDGLAAYGCAGCHGRAEDGVGGGSVGFGAGLRQLHWRGGVTACATCHTDSNPANKTPVPENVLPPYYASPGNNHPAIPNNPCNPAPTYVENFAGTTLGLDNDGNGQFDENDPACNVAATTPGEAGRPIDPLYVTGYNNVTGALSILYGAACSSTNNNIEYGPLSAVSTYGYSGQVCGIGNSGSAQFSLPSGSHFFLVVANDGSKEGSYGKRTGGTERPEDTGATCPIPQDLSNPCQ